MARRRRGFAVQRTRGVSQSHDAPYTVVRLYESPVRHTRCYDAQRRTHTVSRTDGQKNEWRQAGEHHPNRRRLAFVAGPEFSIRSLSAIRLAAIIPTDYWFKVGARRRPIGFEPCHSRTDWRRGSADEHRDEKSYAGSSEIHFPPSRSRLRPRDNARLGAAIDAWWTTNIESHAGCVAGTWKENRISNDDDIVVVRGLARSR